MKKIITTFVACVLCLVSDAYAFNIIVRTVNDGETSYSSQTVDRVEMAPSGDVTIYPTEGDEILIPADEFSALVFNTPSGIGAVNTRPDGLLVSKDGMLTLPGADSTLHLFSLNGQKLASANAASGIDLSRFPAGVYVVKSGSFSTKILVK